MYLGLRKGWAGTVAETAKGESSARISDLALEGTRHPVYPLEQHLLVYIALLQVEPLTSY